MAFFRSVNRIFDKPGHISNCYLSGCKIAWREGGFGTALLAALAGAVLFALVTYS